MSDPTQVRHAALEAALSYVGDNTNADPADVVSIAKQFEAYLNGPTVSPIVGPHGTVAVTPPLVVPAADAAPADVTNEPKA